MERQPPRSVQHSRGAPVGMAFQLDRDQETNALLAGDIRRATRVTMVGVSVFAVVLMVSGSLEAGVTLIGIVAAPLLALTLLAKVLARWCGDASLVPVAVAVDDGNDLERAPREGRVMPALRCRVQPTRPRRPAQRPIAWPSTTTERRRPEH